jgi:cytochrome c
MRCSNLLILAAAVIVAGNTAVAQMPDYQNVGRTPTQDEIRASDISVLPGGKGLPPGSGTPKQGADIFAQKCAYCHGPSGEEGPGPSMSKDANIVPEATTLWDFINRAMPMDKEGSLTPNEVYALTAWILCHNHIIPENAVMDATSLPAVEMPNRNGFYPPLNTGWKPRESRPSGLYP